jgi:ADP-dependent NAD(P)H-hydrate dehydratase / NAD(P)H-hydrate epimerase
MYVVDNATMRAIDEREIASGTPALELMERAGRGITRALLGRATWLDGCTLIFCGRGNNGGDGLVVARLLHEAGHGVRALCVAGTRSPPAQTNFERAHAAGVDLVEVDAAAGDAARQLFTACFESPGRLIVDALLGSGFRPPLSEEFASWCELMGMLGRDIVAIDGPSGLGGDEGPRAPQVPRARWTIALGAPKWGLLSAAGRDLCGRLEVVDLGFASEIVEKEIASATRVARWIDAEWVWRALGRVPLDAHKYSVGTVAVVGGSRGMSGAVSLACHGALRAGAGLVEALVPGSTQPVVDAQCVETLVHGADESGDERLAMAADELLRALATRRDAVVLGPGAGRDPQTQQLFQNWLTEREPDLGVVIDADALFALAQSPTRLGGRTVLTPHSGELGRLLGMSSEEIAADRATVVLEAARRFDAVILHKGAPTFVASPTGDLGVIGAGGPGLATAGSGDVLAGVVGAFLAVGLDAFTAAGAGAWVHGAAGDRGEALRGTRGLVASDLPAAVAMVLLELEGLPQ